MHAKLLESYDFTGAVSYHTGQFPPQTLDLNKIIFPLARALDALVRYDEMLKGLHNSKVLLSPFRNQEAVVSSRMEGTIATMDELLQAEADISDTDDPADYGARNDIIEVFAYNRAMQNAERAVKDGAPISEWLIRSAHSTLLRYGRGANKHPGEYKTEQNYIADRGRKKILFIPVAPAHLPTGMQALVRFMETGPDHPLIKTALAHLEFEALHPFEDGNGRVGRMLVTLNLWKAGLISAPHFYISQYLEDVKDEYIDAMRHVSQHGAWTEWVVFFMNALAEQAALNGQKARAIQSLYETLKPRFREMLNSPWAVAAQDFVFTNPVFRNSRFTSSAGIPRATAIRLSRALAENGLLRMVETASGQRAALMSFEPLMELVRV